MSRLLISIVVAWSLCALAASPSQAQLIQRFEVANAVFSPDGDGVEETTNINFLLDTGGSPGVSVVVLEADSVTPVDTLLTLQPRPVGRTDLSWNGRAWDDTPVSDGHYVVRMSAATSSGPDTTAYRPVFVDTGAPVLSLDSVTPDVYVPGVATQLSTLSIAFTVSNTTPALPGIPRDEVRSAFFQPPLGTDFKPDSLRFAPPYAGASGSYQLLWHAKDGTGLPNGEYKVMLTVVDQAGHSSSESHSFVVDSRKPDVTITSPPTGTSFKVPPAVMKGKAFDASSVKAVDVRFADTLPYLAVTDTATVNDTLRFNVPLTDSLTAEKKYTLTVRATDFYDRVATIIAEYTVDLSSPPAPTLDPFTGEWHTDTYRVTGTFEKEEGDGLARVRILRNGSAVDSLYTLSITKPFEFSRVIGLVTGENVITAQYVDGAGNASPRSNAVVVTFNAAAGLFITSPFGPGRDFQVTLAKRASAVAMHVYDMTGDPVIDIHKFGSGTSYSIPWNGLNGNGDLVDKGPLVAVAEVTYEDGERTIFRELFLFDPYAK